MNRRAFLQLLALLPFAGRLRRMPPPDAETPIIPARGQFVFDGIHGLTFPPTVRHKVFLPLMKRGER